MSIEPEKCAELIRKSRSTVALTGAGISTSAGIPDFRGPQGMYVTRQYDPEKVFSLDWFHHDPTCFYEFSQDFTDTARRLEPTFTHRFLAELEHVAMLDSVVTQNIDILHQLAGSRNVIELHGSYRSATCQSCHARLHELDYEWWCREIAASQTRPVVNCSHCSGVLKPDIVFFGEPVSAFTTAEDAISGCDLLFVLGSSLNVSPASLLPQYTNATTIIVNQGSVMLAASKSRHFVNESLDDYFCRVAEHLQINI